MPNYALVCSNGINNMRFLFLCIACLLLLSGCAAPRVEVPSSASLLGNVSDSRIPIKGYNITTDEKPHEIKSDMRALVGTSQIILFPKQAREYLTEDLRNYVESRFKVTSDAEPFLNIKLEQAYSYFLMKSSGVNLIPFVGVVTSIADGFQEAPISFITEVDVEIKSGVSAPEKITAFIHNRDSVMGWSGTLEKHREIYNKQIASIRSALFARLDAQLLTLWRAGTYVGGKLKDPKRDAASLASELARLDAALSEGKISASEHHDLSKAAKARFVF